MTKASTGIHKQFIVCFALFFFLFSANYFAQNELDYELVSVKFTGNKLFSQAELEKTIISKESPGAFSQFLYSFTTFGAEALYYNPGLVNSDLNRLRIFYRDRGFFEAKISSQVFIDSTNNDTELVYNIEAGEASVVKDYKITGLKNISKGFVESINDRVTIEIGEQYSAEIVNETRALILNFLGDRGYMTVTSNSPSIIVDTLKNEVEITLDFNPGSRFKISELRVKRSGQGKDEVNDQLLLDLVDIKEGDYYSNEKIQLSQIRLYRTNLFNSALIMGVRQDTVNNTVPLEILTNVRKIYQITPEIIFNNDDENKDLNLGLALEFTKRNFLGGARKLSSTFSVASTDPIKLINNLSITDSLFGYADARLRIEQPQLFGKPINTVFEAYYTLRKRSNNFNSIRYGGKINLNFDLPRYTYVTSLSTYLKFEQEETEYEDDYLYASFFNHFIDEVKDSAEVDEVVTGLINSRVFNNSKSSNALIGINIGMNHTNDRQLMFPTRGMNLQIGIEGGNTFNFLLKELLSYNVKTPEYFKVQFSSSVYFPFFNLERSAFALKFKSGLIHSYRGDKFKIPINERFYSGGANSVRGWASRDLYSKSSDDLSFDNIDNLSSQDFELIFNQKIVPGGFFMLEASAEARIHLIGDFGSAVFIDAGNNWDAPNEFSYDEIAVSVGFGFRYYSPFAPIRIDLGMQLWDPQNKVSAFNRNDRFFKNAMSIQIGIGEAF